MIRFAKRNDIDRIMNFIEVYWKKGHILGNNYDLFMYEHVIQNEVTYVISEDKKGEINAILGYIPYGISNRDIMTVMWKSTHTEEPSLGLELLLYLKQYGDVRILASPGSNPKLKGLYKYLGYQFGKMIQWYRLNPKAKYCVAKIVDGYVPEINVRTNHIYLPDWALLEKQSSIDGYTRESKPYKEMWYIKKRYYEHPIYKYEVYGILSSTKKIRLLMIFRVIDVEGVNVVRLIDCIGDFSLLDSVTELLDDVMKKYDAEYVDCYEVGLPDEFMIRSGWKKVEESGNVIPNYFSPFIQENIDIYYFSSDANIVLFKGDGDQDRPN